jgi:hypothetical protein
MSKTKKDVKDVAVPETAPKSAVLSRLSPRPALDWLRLKWAGFKMPSRKWQAVIGVVLVSALLAGVLAKVIAGGWLQGPKSRAVSFARAIQENDMAAARRASTGNDEQYKTVEAMSQVFSAMRNYEAAAVAKFGEAGRSKEMSMPDVVAEAEASDVMTVGDTATMVNRKKPNDKNPMKLVKKSGKWYVDLASMPVDGQTRAMSASAPRIKKAVDETAAEIRAGKYKTPQEAQAALATRMVAAVRPG